MTLVTIMVKDTKMNPSKILTLWKTLEECKEWKQYHILREEIKILLLEENKRLSRKYVKEASERTIMRYLQTLVKEKKLVKKVDLDHKTWYRPRNMTEYSKEILKAWIEVQDKEVLGFMHLFTLEFSLNLETQKSQGRSLDLLAVFKETNKKVLGDLKNQKTIKEITSSKDYIFC